MKNAFLLILLFAGLLYLSTSCQKDYFVPEPIEVPDTISFSAHVIPIFIESCATSNCHDLGGISPDLTADNAYFSLTITGLIDTDNPESSILYQRMKSQTKPMPPSGLLQEAKTEIILNWIAQGALEN